MSVLFAKILAGMSSLNFVGHFLKFLTDCRHENTIRAQNQEQTKLAQQQIALECAKLASQHDLEEQKMALEAKRIAIADRQGLRQCQTKIIKALLDKAEIAEARALLCQSELLTGVDTKPEHEYQTLRPS